MSVFSVPGKESKSPSIFLSVVMPAYNESGSIREVILAHVDVLKKLEEKIQDWELICLDDASTDNTHEIISELAASIPKLKVLKNSPNVGIAKSFTRLYHEAIGTHLYATSSDGQWPAESLIAMLEATLSSSLDLVVGVRKNRSAVYGLKREFISKTFNLIPKLLFGVTVRDAGSIKFGIREVFLFDLISKSPFNEAERIIRANLLNYHVGFTPVDFFARGSGQATGAKWSNVKNSFRDALRCFYFYRIASKSQKGKLLCENK